MNALTTRQVVVVGPSDGLYYLGYYNPQDPKFFVIQPFFNGDLAHAACILLNRARDIAKHDEVPHGR